MTGIKATLAATAAAALLAAGCGSSTPTVPPQAPTISEVSAARSLTGCTAVKPPTLYASAEADCRTSSGQQIDLATFATNQLRDNWVKVATEFGPLIFAGDRYAAVG